MEPTEPRAQRLLVVEDDPVAARLIVSLLRDEPYRLVFASSALDALRLARLHQPDAILLSWTLPEMTGDQLADLLLLHPDTARVPLILFGLEPWLFGEQHRSRAAQVVNKAEMIEELLPRVRDVLGIAPVSTSPDADLLRIRDRSLWWVGEGEDWRAALRGRSRLHFTNG